jgi:protein-tyrosine phosphatase
MTVLRLPSGGVVEGRGLRAGPRPHDDRVDFSLFLAEPRGERISWSQRHVDWPDFRVPKDSDDALAAIREVSVRIDDGQRVEVVCGGGIGRTGTVLAALCILDGLSRREAIAYVRANYHRRAVETPWQARWLRRVEAARQRS